MPSRLPSNLEFVNPNSFVTREMSSCKGFASLLGRLGAFTCCVRPLMTEPRMSFGLKSFCGRCSGSKVGSKVSSGRKRCGAAAAMATSDKT